MSSENTTPIYGTPVGIPAFPIDQEYDPTSMNAQSGIAVSNAIAQSGGSSGGEGGNGKAYGVFADVNEDTIAAFGNGTDADHRRNAFEVLKDGSAKVQTVSKDGNSVINKKYLDTTFWEKTDYTDTNKYYFEGKESIIPLSNLGVSLGNNINTAYKLNMEITKEQLAKIDELRLVRFKDWDTSKINLTNNLIYICPNGTGNVYNIPDFGFVIVGFKKGILNVSTNMNIPVPHAGVFIAIPEEKYEALKNNYVLIAETGEFKAEKHFNVESKNLDIPDISNLALDTERFCVFTTDAPLKDIPYGTSQWLYYYQVKYGCGYGSDTYKNQYGQTKDIPKIGDMLICTQNGYIYKVAGLDEVGQKLAVWYMAGATSAPQVLIEDVHYGTEYPADAVDGQLFFIEEPEPVDYVVEQGTIADWSYKKWASGDVECSRVMWLPSAEGSAVVTVDLPFSFAHEGYLVFLMKAFNGSVVTDFGDYDGGGNTSHTTSSFKFSYTTTTSAWAPSFNILIKGRWK